MKHSPVTVIGEMREWLHDSQPYTSPFESDDVYLGYTAPEVLNAIEGQYPNGVVGWFADRLYTAEEDGYLACMADMKRVGLDPKALREDVE